jgi:hypothetical protein
MPQFAFKNLNKIKKCINKEKIAVLLLSKELIKNNTT